MRRSASDTALNAARWGGDVLDSLAAEASSLPWRRPRRRGANKEVKAGSVARALDTRPSRHPRGALEMLRPPESQDSGSQGRMQSSKTFSELSFRPPPFAPVPSSNISEADSAGFFPRQKEPAPGLRYSRSKAGSSAGNSRCASAMRHRLGVPALAMLGVCMGDDENGDDEEIFAKHHFAPAGPVAGMPSLNLAAVKSDRSSACEADFGAADLQPGIALVKAGADGGKGHHQQQVPSGEPPRLHDSGSLPSTGPLLRTQQPKRMPMQGELHKEGGKSLRPAAATKASPSSNSPAGGGVTPGSLPRMSQRSMTTGSLKVTGGEVLSSQGPPPPGAVEKKQEELRLPPVRTVVSTASIKQRGTSKGKKTNKRVAACSPSTGVPAIKHMHSHHHFHHYIKVNKRGSSKGNLSLHSVQVSSAAGDSRVASHSLEPVAEVGA